MGIKTAIDKVKGNYIFILFIGVIIFFLIRNNYSISEFEKNGERVKGYVYDVKGVGSKGTIRAFYRFTIGDDIYQGFYDNDKVKKNDSIYIIYLPENPGENRAKEFIDNY